MVGIEDARGIVRVRTISEKGRPPKVIRVRTI